VSVLYYTAFNISIFNELFPTRFYNLQPPIVTYPISSNWVTLNNASDYRANGHYRQGRSQEFDLGGYKI